MHDKHWLNKTQKIFLQLISTFFCLSQKSHKMIPFFCFHVWLSFAFATQFGFQLWMTCPHQAWKSIPYTIFITVEHRFFIFIYPHMNTHRIFRVFCHSFLTCLLDKFCKLVGCINVSLLASCSLVPFSTHMFFANVLLAQ